MSYKQKTDFRLSDEWPEVARYYDEIQKVRHHNFSAASYLMKTGKMTIGMIDYGDGTFIHPISDPKYAPGWGPSYAFYRTGRKTKSQSVVVKPKEN